MQGIPDSELAWRWNSKVQALPKTGKVGLMIVSFDYYSGVNHIHVHCVVLVSLDAVVLTSVRLPQSTHLCDLEISLALPDDCIITWA